MHTVKDGSIIKWGVFFDAAGTLIASNPYHKLGVALFEDVLPTLKCFSENLENNCQFHLGVITNWGSRVHHILEELKVNAYFPTVVCADDVPNPKPHKDIFIHAATLTGLLPHQCFFVGDSFFDDAVGACGAGFQGVWLNRRGGTGGDHQALLPMVSSLVEFTQFVFKWINEHGPPKV